MYNNVVKNCLDTIKTTDAQVNDRQVKYIARDGYAEVELYVSVERISYRVKGDAYITAMIKWLQLYLSSNNDLSKLNLDFFIKEFELPDNKLRNAILVMELVEQLKGISNNS